MITLTEFREVGNIVGVEYITKEWVIGGKEGGSCWGTEQYNNITPKEELPVVLTPLSLSFQMRGTLGR